MKTVADFKRGDKVVYIPNHLLTGVSSKMIQDKNLGIVTSVNDTYVFVKYKDDMIAKATRPDDLLFLNNRPDLADKIPGLTEDGL